MDYLNIEEKKLVDLGAIHTAKEIMGQPALWTNVLKTIASQEKQLSLFLDGAIEKADKIILTGAGTSGYIGYSLEGAFMRTHGIPTLTIATTHLVSHPEDYFDSEENILLVSFARSGNSPESVAAVKLGDKHCGTCNHLIITCNSQGNLAKYKFANEGHVFILPPESDDKSLAMTGSYSGMLLSALLINDIKNIDTFNDIVTTLSVYGKSLTEDYLNSIKKVAELPFERAVFLGSGPQYGTAMESHLKLQELTDGRVICKNDSYLGFRHGPKAVVDEKTLMVYYFSNSEEVLKYELDLVNAMKDGKKPLYQLGIATKPINELHIDNLLLLPSCNPKIPEEYLSVCNIVLGQLLGFFKSLKYGLSPDSPSVSGAISRVVKGVVIY